MAAHFAVPVVPRVVTLWCVLGLSLLASPAGLRAAPPAQSPYPRVTLSTCYEVDPKWPERPEGMAWGDLPGVAVNDRDEAGTSWPSIRTATSTSATSRAGGCRSWCGRSSPGQKKWPPQVGQVPVEAGSDGTEAPPDILSA